MTRIAIIAGTYLPERCAVSDYTAHLSKNLREYCIESVVLTSYYAAEAAYDPNAIGVVHGWRLADLFALVQAVRASKAEILHIQYSAQSYGFNRAILLLPLLLRMAGWRSPIVTTIHEYGCWEWQPQKIPSQLMEWLKLQGQHCNWWDREDGFLLTRSDAVITTKAETKTLIDKRLPKLKNRVFHIPISSNVEVAPIDDTKARQLLRQNCNWDEDSLVIAFFGCVHPGKGLETLLAAFKQISAIQPRARLLILGGFESLALSSEDAKKYLVQLQTFVSEKSLSQLVHFTGYLNAQTVSHYLTGADIGVLPCDRPLSLNSTLLTLLDHGLPVVASHTQTSLPVRHSVQLVPAGDITALASELLQLLNNPEQRVQLGNGRVVFPNITWQSIAKAHLDVYNYLANKPLPMPNL